MPPTPPLRRRRASAIVGTLIAAVLSGCGGMQSPQTLKDLAAGELALPADAPVAASEDKAIHAYRELVSKSPQDGQRVEALRRLADLEMENADSGAGAADHRGAIAIYQDLLRDHPDQPDNDRVLYQLARAYEQDGNLDAAVKTLERLLANYPGSAYRDEAQFRRGELLFSLRDYVAAEQAYTTLLRRAEPTPYHERARHMLGWSLFKQGRMEEALQAFLAVLDLKLGDGAAGGLERFARAERELVEDTLRVTGLCLANLQGADSIPPAMNSATRRAYEPMVYRQLAELYDKQERRKDAADTLGAFVRLHPLHAEAPAFQARVIDIYRQSGFAGPALQAEKDYAERYGADSPLRRTEPAAWERAQPRLKDVLADLARHYHAAAQKEKKAEDYLEAARWYRAYLAAFPGDAQAAQTNFLFAELLFESRRYAEAVTEYETTAYRYPAHARSADAGYAALLAYAEIEKASTGDELKRVQAAAVEAARKFAGRFGEDARAAPVLANAADKLHALRDFTAAAAAARQVLAMQPPAQPVQRRLAWTVIAHGDFELGEFAAAEHAYGEVLALMPAADAGRGAVTERLAAAIYQQGERARQAGQLRQAVAQFARIAEAAPQSPVRATAQFDMAAAQIALKDWGAAVLTLEDFRRRFPTHPLQADVTAKLAVAYSELGQWVAAAAEFERLAAAGKDADYRREAQWQAAESYAKAGRRDAAAKAYEHYLKKYPAPLEAAEEARFRLAGMAAETRDRAREFVWQKEIVDADGAGGVDRSERTRRLAAAAALRLAEPAFEEYRRVALVEPLKKQLKLKKAKMEEVLKAYAQVAGYGIAEAATASTYGAAELYADFARALLESQRPAGLSETEAEQYAVMLEEQAYPFEEKAVEFHEINARRAAGGIYDPWVRASYAALAKLRPLRYGKREVDVAGSAAPPPPEASAGTDVKQVFEAARSAFTAGADDAVAPCPAEAPGAKADDLAVQIDLGIACRRRGDFAAARRAYEKAIALDGKLAAAHLDLGILLDLYLSDAAAAQQQYDLYLALTPGGDDKVRKWIADLKNRQAQSLAGGAGKS
jgi:outer membrane protein assembly factor BamD (BamD/ComL family)